MSRPSPFHKWSGRECRLFTTLITSGLPVTQEQPTEHAEIAFAEFTFVSPTTPRRDDFLSQFDDLAFLYVFFERISTLEVGMTWNDPVAMH